VEIDGWERNLESSFAFHALLEFDFLGVSRQLLGFHPLGHALLLALPTQGLLLLHKRKRNMSHHYTYTHTPLPSDRTIHA